MQQYWPVTFYKANTVNFSIFSAIFTYLSNVYLSLFFCPQYVNLVTDVEYIRSSS